MFDKDHEGGGRQSAEGGGAGSCAGPRERPEPLGTVLAGPVDATGAPGGVPRSARDLLALREALALVAPADTEAEAVDRIHALEHLKAACAAAQARETVALESRRRAAEAARGIPAEQRGRGIAGEVALARAESPHRGRRHLALARALLQDLPHTLTALAHGRLSEAKAAVVHRETAWLPSPSDRTAVDAALAERLPFLGERQLAREARRLAQHQDPAAAAAHWDRAVADRRVTLRPAEDGMAYLTAVLPHAQAVACHQSLAHAAATGVATGEAGGRTPQQVLADTLVERLTGRATAGDVPLEVHLVMTDGSLLGTEDTPAAFPGHGTVPAAIARQLVGASEAEVFLRRLYTAPDTGRLVAMDSRRRTFPALLRRMVVLRDDLCRTPYCDARIRHLDHATPHRDGGATSWDNASGLCTRCNHAKEGPGWRHRAGPDGLEVTSPTGHRYRHPTPPLTGTGPPPAPPPPGRTDRSHLERVLVSYDRAA